MNELKKNITKELVALLLVVASMSLSVAMWLTKAPAPKAGSMTTTQDAFYSPIGVATTSATYMSAGKATTTITMSTDGTDTLSPNIDIVSTSSLPRLAYRYESSQNGIDWYADLTSTNNMATTGLMTSLDSNFLWQATATSTSGTSEDIATGLATSTRWMLRMPSHDIKSSWTRMVLWIPIGAPAVTVKAEIVPTRQVR